MCPTQRGMGEKRARGRSQVRRERLVWYGESTRLPQQTLGPACPCWPSARDLGKLASYYCAITAQLYSGMEEEPCRGILVRIVFTLRTDETPE